jgi:PAS domain S-box-containing protein
MARADRPRWVELATVVAAVVAVASLRVIFGQFALQGVLFVVVSAIFAWRIGTRAGSLAALLGLVASVGLSLALQPQLRAHPAAILTRQLAIGIGTYVLLCAVVIAVGRRQRVTVDALEHARAAKEQAEVDHRQQLEAALARETAARREAEEAHTVREELLHRLSHELQRASDLAAIVEWSDDAIVSTDLESTITSWNRAATVLFGYPADEAIGHPIHILIPPERHAEEREVMEKVRRGETVLHFETIRRRRDGSAVEVSLTVSPIRDQQGQVVGASKIARDITQRRTAERDIAELQTRLVTLTTASGALLRSPRVEDVIAAVLDVARDVLPADAYAIWRYDAAASSWRAVAQTGLSPAFVDPPLKQDGEVLLKELAVIPDVPNAPRMASRAARHREEGIRSLMIVPLVADDRTTGTAVFYYRTPHVFSDTELQAARAFGNLASAAVTTAELYDRQRRSRSQSEFLADTGVLLANSLDDKNTLKQVARLSVPYFADFCAIDLVNENGDIERLAVEHLDADRARLAEAFAQQYPENPAAPHSVARALRTRTPHLVEQLTDPMIERGARDEAHGQAIRALDIRSFMVVPMVARERGVGAMTFARGSASPHYTADDLRFATSIASRAALAVDNARAYEEATRASRTKDEFLATLSHELRTPLNAVLGYAHMVNSGMLAGERLTRAMATLERNARSLMRLVDDVLDVSRFVTGRVQLTLQDIDIGTIVAQAVGSVRPAADAKAIRLSVTADAGIRVQGDPDRLQQVFWNLLSNAVKFTPREGLIEVSVSGAEHQAEIVVADSGCGIAADFLPYVFERFRQGDARLSREHGGLGLGLAIARDLVQLHGGTIGVRSAGVDTGAEFRVRLPISQTVASSTLAPRTTASI